LNPEYEVIVSRAAKRDIETILHHLVSSYLSFADTPAEAFARARGRLLSIKKAIVALGRAPFQGTLRDDLMPGQRQVTKESAVFYFTADEARQRVDVLAIFFGGQDHQRHMLRRLLERD
jgi:plasmid stabilization system protein ParE